MSATIAPEAKTQAHAITDDVAGFVTRTTFGESMVDAVLSSRRNRCTCCVLPSDASDNIFTAAGSPVTFQSMA